MQRRSIARGIAWLGATLVTFMAGCGGDDEQPVNTAAGTAAGPVAWTRVFSGEQEQSGWLTATTKTGQIIVAGTMQGRVDFGTAGKIDSVSENDIFLAWVNKDGSVAQVRRFGESGGHIPTGLALDAAGNIILTGIVIGSINFGGGVIDSQMESDAFIAAFGPDGQYKFAKQAGGAGDQTGGQVAISEDGSIVWSGTYQGTVDIGGVSLTSAGETDIFVAKINSSGSTVWARSLGGTGQDGDVSIALLPQGQVLLSGYYSGAPDLGTGALPDTGMGDGQLLASFQANGNLAWSRGIAHDSGYFPFAIRVDESGSPWLVGPFAGQINLWGTNIGTPGQGVAIAKLKATGEAIFSQVFAADMPGYVQAIQAQGGGLVLAGDFENSMKVGGRTLTSAGQSDLFFIWVDAEGRVTRQDRTGGAGAERLGSLSMLPTGQIIVTGSFEGVMNAGGAAYTSSSTGSDGFVMLVN